MPGTKGRSGGKRTGAGRPPAPSVQGRRITQGQEFLHHELTANGSFTLAQMATITHMTRTKIEIALEDGNRIILGY